MNLKSISLNWLFKLRDALGIIHAIVGMDCDMTLSQLAKLVEEELKVREHGK